MTIIFERNLPEDAPETVPNFNTFLLPKINKWRQRHQWKRKLMLQKLAIILHIHNTSEATTCMTNPLTQLLEFWHQGGRKKGAALHPEGVGSQLEDEKGLLPAANWLQ